MKEVCYGDDVKWEDGRFEVRIVGILIFGVGIGRGVYKGN